MIRYAGRIRCKRGTGYGYDEKYYLGNYMTRSAPGREVGGNGGSCRFTRIPLAFELLRKPSSPIEDRGTVVSVAGGDVGADTDVDAP